MKRYVFSIILILMFFLPLVPADQGIRFGDYFVDATMRIDYYHVGDAKNELITLDRVYHYGVWAGTKKNLLDTFNLGRYYIKIYDNKTGKLIFSKGFDSYFGEYQTTSQALEGVKRGYHETALIPFPKRTIKFVVESRNRKNVLSPVFSQVVYPDSVDVIRWKPSKDARVYKLINNGEPEIKVDVAIVAEGYTAAEAEKAKADFKRFTKVFFTQEPYKAYRDRFNIYGVFKPSEDSGCDEPRAGIYRNTVLSTTFNSLGSSRYLLTEDNKALREVAAHVPYDALYIMINTKRYGGGGIYNFFNTFVVDNQWSEYIFLHEFGHHFAGLADEYYTSSIAYNDFYPEGIEPNEPNITRLFDPENLKWKSLVTEGIEIPTLWAKEQFDRDDLSYQKIRAEINQKIAKMKRENAPASKIAKAEAESEKLSKENALRVDNYLENSKYSGMVGAFEGAGYCLKGMYRSQLDCIMFTKGKKPFCKVCEAAIIRVIKHYTE